MIAVDPERVDKVSSRAPGGSWLQTTELWRVVPDGLRETVPGDRCPVCNSNRVHRSRVRGGLEAWRRTFLPWRPFSCSACSWRGWVYPVPSEGPVVDLPVVPVSRRRKRPRTARGRPILSPVEQTRLRNRQRLVVVFFLAIAVSGSVVCMQTDAALNSVVP